MFRNKEFGTNSAVLRLVNSEPFSLAEWHHHVATTQISQAQKATSFFFCNKFCDTISWIFLGGCSWQHYSVRGTNRNKFKFWCVSVTFVTFPKFLKSEMNMSMWVEIKRNTVPPKIACSACGLQSRLVKFLVAWDFLMWKYLPWKPLQERTQMPCHTKVKADW